MMRILYISMLLVFLLTNCRKSKEKSIQSSKDYALVQTNISLVAPLVIHTIQSRSYLLERLRSNEDTLNSCAAYTYIQGDTVDISNQNVQFEILFVNCIDFDGALKNGSLIVTLDNYFDVDSAFCSVLLDNFSINDNIMSGSITLKRIGSNNFELVSSNIKVIVETRQISFTGKSTVNLGTGVDTELLYDNAFDLQDEGSLVDRFGNLSLCLATDLKRNFSCNWITSGFVELEDIDGDSQILDFGNGICDNLGSITYAEEEVTFAIGQ